MPLGLCETIVLKQKNIKVLPRLPALLLPSLANLLVSNITGVERTSAVTR